MSYAGPAARGRSSALRPSGLAKPGAPSRASSVPTTSGGDSSAIVFVAGVALGLAVGAGVALLLAPQSGEDTRRSLVRGGRALTSRGHDAWDDLRDELRRAVRRRRRGKERDRDETSS
jgi:hypothetical protein